LEGITSYYEWLLIVRAGLVEPKHALEEWAKSIKAHRETPGSTVQSAEESSFDTWIRLYRPDENSANVSESYYRRGALIGLALDLSIRESSGGRFSLDDVMRHLWKEYGSQDRGYPAGAFEKAVSVATGFVPRRFFADFIEGTKTLPFETLFLPTGLRFEEKAEKDEDDDDSKDSKGPRPIKEKPDFRWKTKTENGRVFVTEVHSGGAAEKAGVNASDEIAAIDAFKCDEDLLKRIANDRKPGQTVRLHVFRRSQLLEIPVVLGAKRFSKYDISPVDNPEPKQVALFSGWLGQPFPEKKKEEGKDQKPERLE
jgi:predicted metalloprotease with PDZ domain